MRVKELQAKLKGMPDNSNVVLERRPLVEGDDLFYYVIDDVVDCDARDGVDAGTNGVVIQFTREE